MSRHEALAKLSSAANDLPQHRHFGVLPHRLLLKLVSLLGHVCEGLLQFIDPVKTLLAILASGDVVSSSLLKELDTRGNGVLGSMLLARRRVVRRVLEGWRRQGGVRVVV